MKTQTELKVAIVIWGLMLITLISIVILIATKPDGSTQPLSATEGNPAGAIMSVEQYTRWLQQYMLDRGIVWVRVEGELVELEADGRDGPITDAAFCNLMGIKSMERAGQ